MHSQLDPAPAGFRALRSPLCDGDGNRLKKTVGSATTYYIVDDQNPTGPPQVIEKRAAQRQPGNLKMKSNIKKGTLRG